MYTLITFKKCWVDEFDCEEFLVVEDDMSEIVEHFEDVLDPEKSQSWYFGTNQGWEDGEVSITNFNFEMISKAEADVLSKLLTDGRNRSFGLGIIGSILEYEDEDEDEDDDEDDDDDE